MKKILLPFLFLLLVLPAMSQGIVNITGTVTDTATGNPIPNHAVTITNDSTSVWFYNHIVYTDNSGVYRDTVVTAVPGGSPGVLFVRTIDCRNFQHQAVLNYNPANFNFTANFSICNSNIPCSANFTTLQQQSLKVQFTDASTGGGTMRAWAFGDGATSNEMNPVHSYNMPGYYYVSLAIGALGTTCYNDTMVSIYVWDSLAGNCHADFLAVPGVNTTYIFYDQSGGNIISWAWNFDDPASGPDNVSVLQNSSHAYTQTGTYTPCLTVHGADSTCFDIRCKPVVVGSVTPVYLCLSGTVINQVTSLPMPNHAVTWNFVDSLYGPRTVYTNSNGVYADSVMLPPGINSGTYYLWTQDCELFAQFTSTFNAPFLHPVQNFNLSCETILPCQAKMKVSAAGIMTAQFEDKSTGGVSSRTWDFGDGVTSTMENPVHTYGSQGDFLVTLSTVNNITGCTSTKLKSITFTDSLLCNASFTYSYTPDPKTIQFHDKSSGANGVRTWSFGDGDLSTLANPQHTYRHPGLYLVTLSVGNYTLTCWTAASAAVLITDSIVPCQSNFTYTTSPATGPKMVQFTDLSTGSPSQWQWDFGDGDSSVQRYPIHSYAAPGTYHVCLTIAGDYCASTFCQDLVIQDSLVFHQVYGQVFSGNFPLSAGLAMIISMDTTGTYQPFVDVFPVDSNGVYYFTMVPNGSYYILATPSDSTGYLPTYYGNTISWQQATLLTFGTASNPYNISLAQSDQMTAGPGSASGQLNMGKVNSSLTDKVNMLLLNAQATPIGFTPVSSSGAFSFPTLAYGTYYLHAEMPGVTSDYVMITITPEKPHADVVMTFTGNKIIGIGEETNPVNHWCAYPNPVADRLSINIDLKHASMAEVGIYNVTGNMVSGIQAQLNAGPNSIMISTAGLPPGIYALRLSSRDGLRLTTKLVKTR